MRFILKNKKMPEVDDVKIKTRFLWFPKKIDNELRWLEKASWRQLYIIIPFANKDLYQILPPNYYWVDNEWI